MRGSWKAKAIVIIITIQMIITMIIIILTIQAIITFNIKIISIIFILNFAISIPYDNDQNLSQLIMAKKTD